MFNREWSVLNALIDCVPHRPASTCSHILAQPLVYAPLITWDNLHITLTSSLHLFLGTHIPRPCSFA